MLPVAPLNSWVSPCVSFSYCFWSNLWLIVHCWCLPEFITYRLLYLMQYFLPIQSSLILPISILLFLFTSYLFLWGPCWQPPKCLSVSFLISSIYDMTWFGEICLSIKKEMWSFYINNINVLIRKLEQMTTTLYKLSYFVFLLIYCFLIILFIFSVFLFSCDCILTGVDPTFIMVVRIKYLVSQYIRDWIYMQKIRNYNSLLKSKMK